MTIPEIIEKITYKPGWRFKYAPVRNVVMIYANLQSSTNYDKTVGVSHAVSMHGVDPDDDVMVVWRIAKGIEFLEMHEFAEFFKINGRRLVDPHPPTKEG